LVRRRNGEWLTRQEVVNNATVNTKRIALIVADEAYKRQIETTYASAGVRVWVVRLPWWLHNQHMTLAIGGKKPRRAFFFERRLRSLEINPVGLEVDDDLKVVEQTFLAYWAKADNEDGLPGAAFVGPEHLKTAKSKLLDFARWPRDPSDRAGVP
jgi:hypothetical protein